jgi:ABC-type uncharacterized transport system substrate-binding protein
MTARAARLAAAIPAALAAALWAALGAALWAAPARAHPHVFVDATVEAIFDDQGRLAAVRIGWTYDELFSLLLVTDYAADANGDGTVSDAEFAVMRDFDMDWGPDFLGDTYITAGGAPVPLVTGPQEWEAGWRDGRLWSVHTRRLETPAEVGPEGAVVRIYDPGYYVAYAIDPEPKITGRDCCSAQVFVPDLDAAQEELLASLKEYMPGDDLEDVVFPEVGAEFSEEVRLTCAP